MSVIDCGVILYLHSHLGWMSQLRISTQLENVSMWIFWRFVYLENAKKIIPDPLAA